MGLTGIKKYFDSSFESSRGNITQSGENNNLILDDAISISQKQTLDLGELHNSTDINSTNQIDFTKIYSIIGNEAMILITDVNGLIIYVNDKCCESFGYSREELTGIHTRKLNTGTHSKEFYRNLWETVLSGKVWKSEISDKRKDGSIAWNFMSIFPILNDNNQIHQFLTVRSDISEQKEMERLALQKEKQLNSYFEIANEVMGCFDQDGTIMYVNYAYERVLGYKVSESIGTNIFSYFDTEDISKVKTVVDELLDKPGLSMTLEVNLRNKNNSLITCEVTLKNYLHESVIKGIVFSYHDITEQKKLSQEMSHSGYVDFLTDLPNRRYFEKRLEQEIISASTDNTSFAVMLLDIDGFKYINETIGYPGGDILLKDISTRLSTVLNQDSIVCRMGGDEFAVLIRGTDDEKVIPKKANQLVSVINKEPFTYSENEVFLTASIGISVFPYSGETNQALLTNGEAAMYRAKKNGKNQYQIFTSTMNVTSFKQFTLRNDVKRALLNNEFCLNYQPRVNPATNKIMSAEALITWDHPKWGVLTADEFIPITEESGLIVPLGTWMIRKICFQLKEWEEKKIPLKKVSLNLSAIQLRQPTFVDLVSSILKETGINPNLLELEISETIMVDEVALLAIKELKALGIGFALDGFGTGYSSFNQFRNIHCETIKIDKSLIQDIVQDIESKEIVETIISLCRKLNKSVVAEGVETIEQLSMLKQMACNEVQGTFYTHPVEVEQYSKYLKKGKWTLDTSNRPEPNIDHRKYFRILLDVALVGDMTIESIGNRKINIGSSEVLIDDIGPGGLSFQSSLKLPVKEDFFLRFSTEILANSIQLSGKIIWHEELNHNDHKYGVEFNINENEREELVKILNQMQIKLKHKSILPNSRFASK